MIKNIKNKSQVNIILSSLRYLFLIGILCLATTCLQNCYSDSKPYKIFPANKAIDINPDTHLKILFHGEPVLGEDRDKVVVCYANNEVFNPHPANIVTNERPGTFPLSTYGPHMWIRNTDANHGNVFLNCTFRMIGSGQTTIARTSDNRGKGYPYAEAVLLNCALDGIRPEGWGIQGNATSNIHYWEYNSVNLSDGKPVDVSRRHPISRQLIKEKDAEIIADYSNPTNVLGGWTPEMAPVLLSQPEKVKGRKGETAEFKVKVAAIPEASIQWLKDDKPMNGENESILTIPNAEKSAVAGYSVLVQNRAGSVTSREAQLVID